MKLRREEGTCGQMMLHMETPDGPQVILRKNVEEIIKIGARDAFATFHDAIRRGCHKDHGWVTHSSPAVDIWLRASKLKGST